jgi:nucleoside-diphosphate-sugar epimerase
VFVKAMSLFDGGIRSFRSSLGKRTDYDTSKARERLGWSPRPIDQTIAEAAESLVAARVVDVPAAA